MLKSIFPAIIPRPPQLHLTSLNRPHFIASSTRTFSPRYYQRRMSAAAPTKKEFLCILPDKPGVVGKRLEVRGAHLEGAKKLESEGTCVLGGAMLNTHSTPADQTPSFKGSALMVVAENEGEVRRLLQEDVYGRSGVWDLERAEVIPFKSAVRVGL